MSTAHHDNKSALQSLTILNQLYHYYSLAHVLPQDKLAYLPKSLKILMENILRHLEHNLQAWENIALMVTNDTWLSQTVEIGYYPGRVMMQDFTGVPAVVDLAVMRDAVVELGGDPLKINPLIPVDLVIDHSIMVDEFGKPAAFAQNIANEMLRNHERYRFLRWAQQNFSHFRVVPPGKGICHQVNLEHLACIILSNSQQEKKLLSPEILVGTDSHTTMINSLGVLGWGVGGIEAEAAMLGQPLSLMLPEIIGVQLIGKRSHYVTATDLVLTITKRLRQYGVVGKFVEFFGDSLQEIKLADRATIANMTPEFGATCSFFPVDEATIDYLHLTGRSSEQIAIVEAYCKAQGLWRSAGDIPKFIDVITIDMAQILPSVAGPSRPQDQIFLPDVPVAFNNYVAVHSGENTAQACRSTGFIKYNKNYRLPVGAVVIAAITSCTNTSNPDLLITAGLLAKNAVLAGLKMPAWVKTSFAPGSKVATSYLSAAGLTHYLDQLGFNLVGYGCTTCIGNSGPLLPEVETVIQENQLTVAAVLSGNRNFAGRIHPLVQTNWLASPPLVIAYALAGTVLIDLTTEPLGQTITGKNIYLHDIWPAEFEVTQSIAKYVTSEIFSRDYEDIFIGDKKWQAIMVPPASTYIWQKNSTYICQPPYLTKMTPTKPPAPTHISAARILMILGDSITTDHISPAGAIKANSPAGYYLQEHGITAANFNSYGSRRGNHQVMMRGTFANIRIQNEMLPNIIGGVTRHYPSGETVSVYDAAMRYQQANTPLIIIAGKEYGTGSSRDWAAKGPSLLGVRAILAESFERIHRSNLIGMGILPLEFPPDYNRKKLSLTGSEKITITGLSNMQVGSKVNVTIFYEKEKTVQFSTRCRLDTMLELTYFYHAGILPYMVRQFL